MSKSSYSRAFVAKSKRQISEDKALWTNLGTVIRNNDTGSLTLLLDAVPASDSRGKIVIHLFEPTEKDKS